MSFPVLYAGLFLSVRQPPDGERRVAVLWPLAAVVALERLVLDSAQPSKDRFPADAFLTCVLASSVNTIPGYMVDNCFSQPLGGASSGVVCASAD